MISPRLWPRSDGGHPVAVGQQPDTRLLSISYNPAECARHGSSDRRAAGLASATTADQSACARSGSFVERSHTRQHRIDEARA